MNRTVQDNAQHSRYELELEGGTAFIDYRRQGKVRILTHAEVPPAFRGQGVAERLTAGALELVRAQGEKVVPRCPYVALFIRRHPQFQDLVESDS